MQITSSTKSAKSWNSKSRLKINENIGEEEKQKVKKKRSKRLDKEWIMVGNIPDVLAEILFLLMKTWKIYSTKQ